MIKRKLVRIESPRNEPGFLKGGHIARTVVTGGYALTDPFIYLMDDMLDKKDSKPAGGPHPHAGFETVSLLVEGEITEMMESMKQGDFQVMTAGSGIVHTQPIAQPTKARLFQMWLSLPEKDRWTTPRLQVLPNSSVPVVKTDTFELRLYSGSVEGISSPVQNYVPLIVVEIILKATKEKQLSIPANFNAFIYVISGNVLIGDRQLNHDQVGWLDLATEDSPSEVFFQALGEDTRFVMYAAKPQGGRIVSHGPFIAGNENEINDLFIKYHAGSMHHIEEASEEQRITY